MLTDQLLTTPSAVGEEILYTRVSPACRLMAGGVTGRTLCAVDADADDVMEEEAVDVD